MPSPLRVMQKPEIVGKKAQKIWRTAVLFIPNGCFDAYEVKVNKDIFKYQEQVKLVCQFQRFLLFFNGLLEFASFP